MNRSSFGKLQIKRPLPAGEASASMRDLLASGDNPRLVVWAIAGLVTGFIVAAIECL
jgi:hypothetical protein